jgi:hypothetical protein
MQEKRLTNDSINIKMGKILQQFIEDEKEYFIKEGLLYCPSSIYHGVKINGPMPLSDTTLLKIEVSRLADFIDYLFETSKHCDHISNKDAWIEFEQWEFKQ